MILIKMFALLTILMSPTLSETKEVGFFRGDMVKEVDNINYLKVPTLWIKLDKKTI